jgi:hypothetical protein
MERFDPSPIIENSHRLTDIFGYWPTFHDAEIQSIHLSRRDGKPWEPESDSPTINLTVHLWEMTKDVSKEGFFVLAKHTLTELQFRNVHNVELSEFNYQNSIMEMIFGIEPENLNPSGGGRLPAFLTVEIAPSFGLYAKFKCQSAEVVSAIPSDEEGNPLSN